jgi:hypothetical protein
VALVDLLMAGAQKDRRARLHERLLAETKAEPTANVAEAARNFVRLAMIEGSLAQKPDRVQIYVWYSLAAALGYPGAGAMRDEAFVALTPRETQGAEAAAMAGFAAWCLAQSDAAPGVCAVMAEGAVPQAASDNG